VADVRVSKLHTVNGEISLPGDKSVSHRAAMLASIAHGTSIIKNFSTAIDCQSTLDCMRQLGVAIHRDINNIHVRGKGLRALSKPGDVLNCGNSGTTMRLLCGLLAGQDFSAKLTGDASLSRRPMDRIIKPLVNNGADITGEKDNRFAPLTINGKALNNIHYELPVASSQVKSAVLLAGLYAGGAVSVVEPVKTRDHTERMLDYCGVDISRDGNVITLGENRQPGAREFVVPGDISSAAFLIALGLLIPGGALCIKDVGINPTRTGLLTVLEKMGADIRIDNERLVSNEPVGNLIVRNAKLRAVDIGGALIPKLIDELPLLAVIATQAQGRTVVHDALELRVKESDRIAAIVAELKKMGASIEETGDGFIVDGPTPLKGAECSSYNDHRIAMALSVAGWTADGETVIKDADCVGISCPEFFDLVGSVT